YRFAEHVSEHLLPEWAARAASRKPNRFHVNTHLFNDVEAVLLTVGDAFHEGPDQIGSPVFSSQSDPAAARCRVQVWGALTHQVWKPEQSLRARGRSR